MSIYSPNEVRQESRRRKIKKYSKLLFYEQDEKYGYYKLSWIKILVIPIVAIAIGIGILTIY